MDLCLASARFALGKLGTEEAISAVSKALDRGVYSDALGAIVFQERIWSEIGPLFEKALHELGVGVPTRKDALSIIARHYADQIVAGNLSPYDGARKIWWEVSNEPDADRSLLIFVGLASEWEDDHQHRPQYEADILRESHRLLLTKLGADG